MEESSGINNIQIPEINQNTIEADFHDIRCSFCYKYLSIPPIFTSQSGKVNKCGRCEEGQTVEQDLFRNKTYEKLAQYVQFPCSESENCKEQLAWGKITEHEAVCPFRLIVCPHINCWQMYEINDLLTHFRNCHKVYSGNVIYHNFIVGKSDVVLIDINNSYFLAFSTTNDGFMWLNVFTLTAQKNKFKFAIGFTGNTCNINYTSCHNISTYPGKHNQTNIFQDNYEIIKIQSLKDFLKIDRPIHNIKIRLEIFEENLLKPQELGKSAMSCFKNIIVNVLECPICFVIMNSYIYLCTTGHSICASCKSRTDTCPTCRASFQNGRNYALEELYQKLETAKPMILS